MQNPVTVVSDSNNNDSEELNIEKTKKSIRNEIASEAPTTEDVDVEFNQAEPSETIQNDGDIDGNKEEEESNRISGEKDQSNINE
ncbi:hypothetical protein JTB14_003480 [Gonioctena quinquepunctata]|nr:hypothetical protein JTB14_003480 [Gonioctena quinquepunctata]